MRARRSGNFARPYPALLISLTLVIWPSTGPVLHEYPKALVIATRSSVIPAARRANGFKSLAAAVNQPLLEGDHVKVMQSDPKALDEPVACVEHPSAASTRSRSARSSFLRRSGARSRSQGTWRVSSRRLDCPRTFGERHRAIIQRALVSAGIAELFNLARE